MKQATSSSSNNGSNYPSTGVVIQTNSATHLLSRPKSTLVPRPSNQQFFSKDVPSSAGGQPQGDKISASILFSNESILHTSQNPALTLSTQNDILNLAPTTTTKTTTQLQNIKNQEFNKSSQQHFQTQPKQQLKQQQKSSRSVLNNKSASKKQAMAYLHESSAQSRESHQNITGQNQFVRQSIPLSDVSSKMANQQVQQYNQSQSQFQRNSISQHWDRSRRGSCCSSTMMPTEELEKSLTSILKPNSSLSYLKKADFIQRFEQSKREQAQEINVNKEVQQEYAQKLFEDGNLRKLRAEASSDARVKQELEECTFTPLVHYNGQKRTNEEFWQCQLEYDRYVAQRRIHVSQREDEKITSNVRDRPQVLNTALKKQLDANPLSSIPVHSRLYYLHAKERQEDSNPDRIATSTNTGNIQAGGIAGERFYKTKRASVDCSRSSTENLFHPQILERSKQLSRNDEIGVILYKDACRRKQSLESAIKSTKTTASNEASPQKWRSVSSQVTENMLFQKFQKEFALVLSSKSLTTNITYKEFLEILQTLGFTLASENSQIIQPVTPQERSIIDHLWTLLKDPNTNTICQSDSLFQALIIIQNINATNTSSLEGTSPRFLTNNSSAHFTTTTTTPFQSIQIQPHLQPDMEKRSSTFSIAPQSFNTPINPVDKNIANPSLNPLAQMIQSGINKPRFFDEKLSQQSQQQSPKSHTKSINNRSITNSRSKSPRQISLYNSQANATTTTTIDPNYFAALNQNRLAFKTKSQQHQQREQLQQSKSLYGSSQFQPSLNMSNHANQLANAHRQRILSQGQDLLLLNEQTGMRIPNNGLISHPQLLHLTQLVHESQTRTKLKAQEEQEIIECSFNPQINLTHRSTIVNNSQFESDQKYQSNQSRLPQAIAKTHELHEKAASKSKYDRVPGLEVLTPEILSECTFTPNISQPPQFKPAKQLLQQAQRSIEQSIDRMKRARADKEFVAKASSKGHTNTVAAPAPISQKPFTYNKPHEHLRKPQKETFFSNTNSNHSSQQSSHAIFSPAMSIHDNNNVPEKTSPQQYPLNYHNINRTDPIFSQSIEQEDSIPLLYVDVNLGPGIVERIVVHEGEKADDIANSFAQLHNLDEDTRLKFKDMLEGQIRNILCRIDEEELASFESEQMSHRQQPFTSSSGGQYSNMIHNQNTNTAFLLKQFNSNQSNSSEQSQSAVTPLAIHTVSQQLRTKEFQTTEQNSQRNSCGSARNSIGIFLQQ